MSISKAKPSRQNKRYSGARGVDFTLDRRRVQLLLTRRLNEKIAAYERAAVSLESNGETDAADALYQAARKLKIITKRTMKTKKPAKQKRPRG